MMALLIYVKICGDIFPEFKSSSANFNRDLDSSSRLDSSVFSLLFHSSLMDKAQLLFNSPNLYELVLLSHKDLASLIPSLIDSPRKNTRSKILEE